MRSLWSEWPRIQQVLPRRHVLLGLDFDGTLAPIAARPSQARMPAATRAALARLARAPGVSLGIVSGRELSELRRRVGLKGIHYIGSHGLEWRAPGGARQIKATPAQRRLMRKLGADLRRALAALPGIWVERKPASVAVHLRNANRRGALAAAALTRRVVRGYGPRLTRLKGKKVIEFLPAGAPDKGAAVHRLMAALRRAYPGSIGLYVGDDATDEAAFRRLRKQDFGILVGGPRRTHARFYLRTPQDVGRLLQRLCVLMS